MTLVDEFSAFIEKRSGPFARVEVCEFRGLTHAERRSVPAVWLDIVARSGSNAVAAALDTWQHHIPDRLPGAKIEIARRGVDMFLGRTWASTDVEPKIALIYVLTPTEYSRRPFDACFGFAPAATTGVQPRFPHLASGIGAFNSHVHDGLRNRWGGVLPTSPLKPVADAREPSDFEYLDTRLRALPLENYPKLENLVVVAGEGRRGTGVDISTAELVPWEIYDDEGSLEQSRYPDHWTSIDARLMRVLESSTELYELMGYNHPLPT